MTRQIHIEKKDRSVLRAVPELRAALRDPAIKGQWVSVQDLNTSGIPHDLIEPALLHLASRAGGEVDVDNDLLVFRFQDLDHTPWTLRLPASLQVWGHRAWRMTRGLGRFTAGLATSAALTTLSITYIGLLMAYFPSPAPTWVAGIVIALIVATFLFSVPLFAVLLAIFVPFGALAALFSGEILAFLFMVPAMFILFAGMVVFYDLFRKWTDWLARVFRHALNMGRENVGRLDDEREFLQLASAQHGRVTLGDLMKLFGWTRQQAFEELTQLMLDYGGDVSVDTDGRLAFEFEGLTNIGDAQVPEPIWKREKRPSQVFGEKARRADITMLGFWLVGIAAPFLLFLGLQTDVASFPTWFASAQTALQVALSAGMGLMALVPFYVALRRFVVAMRDKRYTVRERFLRAMERASSGKGEVRAETETFDADVLLDLGGDIDAESGKDGEVVFHFPELKPEESVEANFKARMRR